MSKGVARIETGYQPRPLQEVLHPRLRRFNVIVCHRRFGKTVFSVNEMIDRSLRCELKDPQMAYIAPTYGQAEKIAWQMLKNHTRMIPGVEYNEAKLRCVIPRPWRKDRITIYLLGAESPDTIRGIYLDGVIFDEYATMDPRIWGEVVRPALSDRRGWAIFIGTPAGKNHFYDVYQIAQENKTGNWYSCIHKASTSGILSAEELVDMRAEMSDEQYEQELECSFTAALIGAYYGKELELAEKQGRIGQVPFDPALLVDTFWDLGVNDSTTIWFIQQYRQEVRVIDYLEMSGEGIPYYAKKLKEDHRKDYCYRSHYWPHDGAARDLSTGEARETTARGLGIKPLIILPKHNLKDGIDAGRLLIRRAYFDLEKCSRGLDALRSYQQKYDSKNKIYMDQPLHNWASHGADAWRSVAMGLRPGPDRDPRKGLPTRAKNDYNIFDY